MIYNALGMRQHRPMSVEPEDGEIRIGLFGDSFTENIRLPVAYSFSEVLDYLLHQQSDRITVLNFGVDGYGLDQSYLYYLHSPPAQHLEHVVYFFFGNDIRNLYETQLYGLDDDGRLMSLGIPSRPWWMPIVSRLALTYLVIDTSYWMQGRTEGYEPWSYQATRQVAETERAWTERFSNETATRINVDFDAGTETEELDHYWELARVILAEWAREATVRQDDFRVALIPYPSESRVADRFAPHRVLNLFEEFQVYGLPSTRWTFANNPHWNELGNLLAAVHLYRELAPTLPGTPMTHREILRSVHAYYRAFRGWRPPMLTEPWDVPATELESVRRRYLALE
ncbi:MAG: SGNH/GDSL hydrolase family protein [Acidobacteria bacterium]|nr:SGNH/GDSL hydrolase family protein [Acidobacteriota bacterium]MYJ06028.1 SGNH/GDSL hydrolase family protein [Acidobacteriota bacterium]